MIAATALVSRALGADDRAHAREVAGSALAWLVLVTGVATLASLPFVRPVLALLGATGDTLDTAALFTFIVLPTTPLLGLGMCATGLLRAVGDAKRAMYTTLWFGGIILVLDPFMILAVGLGVPGAAIATAIARIGMVAYGLSVLIRRHDLIARPAPATMRRDFAPLAAIGVPAILTNIATPIGNGYMTAAIAAYGDAAVAGWTIISRLIPVAFGGLFALSGAVGPVVGQNFGAGLFDRVRGALNGSSGSARSTSSWFPPSCLPASTASSRLRGERRGGGPRPPFLPLPGDQLTPVRRGASTSRTPPSTTSTTRRCRGLNWGRATLGTVPFVIAGSWLAGGSAGALIASSSAALPFGIIAMIFAYRIVARLGRETVPPAVKSRPRRGPDARAALPEASLSSAACRPHDDTVVAREQPLRDPPDVVDGDGGDQSFRLNT
jgi:hypothetical protein